MSGDETSLGESISEVQAGTVIESFFQEHDLFHGLSAEEVREVVHFAEEKTFEPGDLVFKQGDVAASLVLVENGELEVRSEATGVEDEVVLAHIGPGSVVGEMAILNKTLRSATVVAISETHAFVLAADVFQELRNQRRAVVYKVILNLAQILGERRRRTDARVAEVFADPGKTYRRVRRTNS